MGILKGLFRSRDKPENMTIGGSPFFFKSDVKYKVMQIDVTEFPAERQKMGIKITI